jgi:hypothetical protein
MNDANPFLFVIPAKAGIHRLGNNFAALRKQPWILACAGMTVKKMRGAI